MIRRKYEKEEKLNKKYFEKTSCKRCKEQFLIMLKKKGSGVGAWIAMIILNGDKEKISALRNFICSTVNLFQWNGLKTHIRESNAITENKKEKVMNVLNGFISI
jgi:hypothetical protein